MQLDCIFTVPRLQLRKLAGRTNPFDRIVDRIHDKTFGQLYDQVFYMIHAIGLMTNFAIKMNVSVPDKQVSVSLRQISYFIDPLPSSNAWTA